MCASSIRALWPAGCSRRLAARRAKERFQSCIRASAALDVQKQRRAALRAGKAF